MAFFSNKNYLGIDIGNSGVKVVELAAQGRRPRLVTYGYVETALNLIKPTQPEQEMEKIVAIVKKILEEARISSKQAIAALPSFAVFSSIISLPKMSKEELGQAINWEAKKFVPLPIEEMVLDWRQLDQEKKSKGFFHFKSKDKKNKKEDKDKKTDIVQDKESAKDDPKALAEAALVNNPAAQISDSGKKQRVLMAAAPKDLVDRYVDLLNRLDLELVALETDSFALERALIGRDPSVIMVVDLGSFLTDITIVEDGIPILTRSVDVGGETITQAVARSLNVSQRRAEQFKRDIGFTAGEIGSVPKVIETTINPVINEIKYSFDLYLGQHKDASVEKIILTGGSSVLPGLVGYLKRILNINVFIGDPWARVIYPLELKFVLQKLGPRFAVATGLAMREIV